MRWILWLWALLVIPAAALLFVLLSDRNSAALGAVALFYFVGAAIIYHYGMAAHPTEAGLATLDRWRAAAAEGGGGLVGHPHDASRLGPLVIYLGPAIAAGAALYGLARLARWARPWLLPQFVEFDGQVIRQWFIQGDEDTADEHHVAIDDAVRGQAWDLDVGAADLYRRLPPGTFVHVRVSLANRSRVRVEPVAFPYRR